MANTKISDLTVLTTPAVGDLLNIVDISDTSMSPDGTNKQITKANLVPTAALLLDYVEASDLWTGGAVSATTWTDLTANQTFTVTDATKLVQISLMIGMIAGANTGPAAATSRAIIDSAGTPITKYLGLDYAANAAYANPFSTGLLTLSGLTAAAHTVKLQFRLTATGIAYLRASTQPDQEFLTIQVVQLP